MKKHGGHASERDLARVLVAWLREEGWTVYQEVHHGSCTCDVVATRGPLVWAIETKLTFGVPVVEQAANWLWRANMVSVATPPTTKGSWALREFMRDRGIGWLHVRAGDSDRFGRKSVEEHDHPAIARVRDNMQSLRAVLRPEQLNGVEAGGNSGGYHTPFKETCERVAVLVHSQPGITVKEVIATLGKGHYGNTSSARAGIFHWGRMGKIPRVILRTTESPARFYPLEDGQEAGVEARRERLAKEAQR